MIELYVNAITFSTVKRPLSSWSGKGWRGGGEEEEEEEEEVEEEGGHAILETIYFHDGNLSLILRIHFFFRQLL